MQGIWGGDHSLSQAVDVTFLPFLTQKLYNSQYLGALQIKAKMYQHISGKE